LYSVAIITVPRAALAFVETTASDEVDLNSKTIPLGTHSSKLEATLANQGNVAEIPGFRGKE
jgi:hypothetical protein